MAKKVNINMIILLVIFILITVGVIVLLYYKAPKVEKKEAFRIADAAVKYMPDSPQYFVLEVTDPDLDDSKTNGGKTPYCLIYSEPDEVSVGLYDGTDYCVWYYDDSTGQIINKVSKYALESSSSTTTSKNTIPPTTLIVASKLKLTTDKPSGDFYNMVVSDNPSVSNGVATVPFGDFSFKVNSDQTIKNATKGDVVYFVPDDGQTDDVQSVSSVTRLAITNTGLLMVQTYDDNASYKLKKISANNPISNTIYIPGKYVYRYIELMQGNDWGYTSVSQIPTSTQLNNYALTARPSDKNNVYQHFLIDQMDSSFSPCSANTDCEGEESCREDTLECGYYDDDGNLEDDGNVYQTLMSNIPRYMRYHKGDVYMSEAWSAYPKVTAKITSLPATFKRNYVIVDQESCIIGQGILPSATVAFVYDPNQQSRSNPDVQIPFVNMLLSLQKPATGISADCPISLIPDNIDYSGGKISTNVIIPFSNQDLADLAEDWEDFAKDELKKIECMADCEGGAILKCTLQLSSYGSCLDGAQKKCLRTCLDHLYIGFSLQNIKNLDKMVISSSDITLDDGTVVPAGVTCTSFIQPADNNVYMHVKYMLVSPTNSDKITAEANNVISMMGTKWYLYGDISFVKPLEVLIEMTIPVTCNDTNDGYMISKNILLEEKDGQAKNNYIGLEVSVDPRNQFDNKMVKLCIDSNNPKNSQAAINSAFKGQSMKSLLAAEYVGIYTSIVLLLLGAPGTGQSYGPKICGYTSGHWDWKGRLREIVVNNISKSASAVYQFMLSNSEQTGRNLDCNGSCFIGCPQAPLGCPYPPCPAGEICPTDGAINYSPSAKIDNGTCIPASSLIKDVAPILENNTISYTVYDNSSSSTEQESVQGAIDYLKTLQQPQDLVGYSIQPVAMSEQEKQNGNVSKYVGVMVEGGNVSGCRRLDGAYYYAIENGVCPSSIEPAPEYTPLWSTGSIGEYSARGVTMPEIATSEGVTYYGTTSMNQEILPDATNISWSTTDQDNVEYCKQLCSQDSKSTPCIGFVYDTANARCYMANVYGTSSPNERLFNKIQNNLGEEANVTYMKKGYEDFFTNIRYQSISGIPMNPDPVENGQDRVTSAITLTSNDNIDVYCGQACDNRSDCVAFSVNKGDSNKNYTPSYVCTLLKSVDPNDIAPSNSGETYIKQFRGCELSSTECSGESGNQSVMQNCSGNYCIEVCSPSIEGAPASSFSTGSDGRSCNYGNDTSTGWYNYMSTLGDKCSNDTFWCQNPGYTRDNNGCTYYSGEKCTMSDGSYDTRCCNTECTGNDTCEGGNAKCC